MKSIAGKVFRAKELVEYQRGAVVSRTLIKRPSGSVTVFAFDAGESLSEHAVPFEALIEVVEGEAKVTLSGQAHRMGAGESLLMPAKAPHAVEAPKRFKMLLTLYKA